MIADCVKLNVVPAQDSTETNDNSPTDIEQEILHKLIPTINSVYMIAKMIETNTLGPIDLGPYQQYIQDLKECALIQDDFAKDLVTHLRRSAANNS